ncbi:putative late blight resistance protein homolog R1B-23 isoform X1 [Ipomoea triloba]|uniref:putative late blight resistance protein homolog R1B-23 isoform X1 n=1 Tax=Ipomoea triloba TaxID=35885 RepID=UPI00125D0441|nr:putative late blight resistance protein homolog R1B-23 isoform X1 [Ipomoea triloba]
MGCVALTSLMATIELQFLRSIPRVSILDDELPMKFFEKLSSLQAFLQEKSRGSGAAIQDLEIQIRDFALNAEDRIEIQLSNFLLSKNREDQQKAAQKLHQTLIEAAENAAHLLKIINESDDESNECQSLIPWSLDTSLRLQPPKLEGKMVGRRHDYLLVKNQLLYSDQRRVILIVGMNGIGKTTLAASVYEDSSVASHFDVRAWITMSGEYNVRQTLHDLLLTLVEPDHETRKRTTLDDDDDLLAKQVSKCLKGKRYLIVLDNLWNNRVWDDIQGYFPNDNNGSRIVLTTTHFDQGSYTSLDCIHNMALLDSKESWDLFCSDPFLEKHMAPKFEKIRSHVLEKCEGLPLSIVTVAQRLSKCNNIRKEWEKVEKELELLGFLDSSALTLRYNQLPQYLKVCFLYLGVFPKRTVIRVKQLVRLWIAEGVLNPFGNEGLESQAYEYLRGLIDRSLVSIENWSSDGKIKSCKMHSALHSFCVREAQKSSILCAVNTQQYPQGSFNMFANSCRWLSLYKHSFDYYVLFRTNTPRSIFFFQKDDEISVPFKLLRVLASAPSSFFQRVPTQLHDLIFLRYLSVKEWFKGLDYIVSANRNLQTLVVSDSNESQPRGPTLHLPSTIWESPQLQHLELDSSYVIDPPSMIKDNMQTLSWVCPTHCRTEVYRKFPNIKKLKIFGFCDSPIILDDLNYLVRLERLTISVSFGCIVTLPKPSMFPSRLKKLSLNDTSLSKKDLMIIGMLPQLEVLKLKNVFHGEVWEIVEGRRFNQLRFLHLEDKKLKKWMANKESFQCLERLVLRFCCCLEKIPRMMNYVITLKSIELEGCGPFVVVSALHIQEFRNYISDINFEVKIKGSEAQSLA